jgi:DNA-binding Lrp family transcriptional regulator
MKDVELRLISELMKNSRRSDRELAKAIGVSQPTVSRMIKRLEKEGVIKEYTMIRDFLKLGLELLALTLVKLRKALDAEKIDEARKAAQQSLKKGPFEIIMLERGLGLGYDGLIVSIHKDYSSYQELKKWLRQFTFLELKEADSFLISLSDKIHYRPLTLTTLAKYLLTLETKTES